MRSSLICLFLAAGFAAGQDTPKPDGIAVAITGPDRIEPYKIGVFKLPDAGQVLLNDIPELSIEQRGSEMFVTGKPGKYTISGHWIDFEAKKAGKVSKTFLIGDPPPPPPPPPPPGPPDPILSELRTIYASDVSITKGQDIAVLGEVYKLMAAECMSASYATAADLGAKYKTAVTAAINGRLTPLRTRCSKEIEAAMGDPDLPMTEADRKKLSAAFTRLALVLPQVPQ